MLAIIVILFCKSVYICIRKNTHELQLMQHGIQREDTDRQNFGFERMVWERQDDYQLEYGEEFDQKLKHIPDVAKVNLQRLKKAEMLYIYQSKT